MMKTAVLFATTLFAACTDGAMSTEEILASTDAVTLHGTLAHDVDAPHTGAGPFARTATSYATVRVSAVAGEDAPSTELAATEVAITTALPLDFTITLSADALAGARDRGETELYFEAEAHQARGSEITVGDLVLETYVAAEGEAVLTLTKLESCAASDAGGYCLE